MSASKITSQSMEYSVATVMNEIKRKVSFLLADTMNAGQSFTLDLNIWIEGQEGVSYQVDTRPKSDGITLA